jgi:Rrf2 family transcriptional regulator, iron-sulfur cluster assembly transcription factor
MRITTKGRYALRAILHLTRKEDGKPVSIRKLSEETCLSPEFLEQIFFRLRKAGIITSTRGPGGGFAFTKPPQSVSIDDIFMAIDEGYFITPCSTEDPEKPLDCSFSDDCCACEFWQHTYRFMRKYFSSISIQNILDGVFPSMG